MRRRKSLGTIESECFSSYTPDRKTKLFSGWFYRDFSRIKASYMQQGTWSNLIQCLPVTDQKVVRAVWRSSCPEILPWLEHFISCSCVPALTPLPETTGTSFILSLTCVFWAQPAVSALTQISSCVPEDSEFYSCWITYSLHISGPGFPSCKMRYMIIPTIHVAPRVHNSL